MKKIIILVSVICALVLVLAACSAGSANLPGSIDELCALIGQDISKAPYYNSSDGNLTIEKDEDGGDVWYGISFNSDNSKYYIAGISAVPEDLEWEAENGIITNIDIWYNEEAFDSVEEWFDENEGSFTNSLYRNGSDYFNYTVNGTKLEIILDYSQCCLSISESNGIF